MFPNYSHRHSEWRKLAKKSRRKRLRQAKARERDDLLAKEQQSPTYQRWSKEEEVRELFERQEEERLREKQEAEWLRVEVEAQKQWRELQIKLQAARDERAKQNAKIRLEWEKEQKRLQEIKEQKERELEEQERLLEQRNKEIEEFLDVGGQTPEHLKTVSETNPNKELCPFFQKTSACRFFDACSRNHVRPGINNKLVIRNFYSHYSLEKTCETEHGSDSSLEFDKDEMYDHFKEFFYDVVSEFEKCGRIIYFYVCCNHESHLRGNVYIEYESNRSALKCYKMFNGRFYGGKQLSVEFCEVDSWKKAICGLFFSKRCPKGSACNFLHVFKNPKHLYCYNVQNNYKRGRSHTSERREWRWSESPERIIKHTKRKRSRSRSRKSSRSKRKRSISP